MMLRGGISRIAGASLLALALAACGGEAAEDTAVPPASGAARTPGAEAPPPIPVMGPERRILAFGDSLFAGYGLDEGESYPARLEMALRAKGVNARIANAGVSGDTTAAGRQRLAFTLDAQEEKPDLFILELGGNDMLRGLSPAETRANLAAMLEELKARDIPVLLMGMRAPPNYGPEYQRDFDAIYADLAQEYGAQLVPFWLESIYENPNLFQADRIHPTEEGIEQLVEATLADVREALPEEENEG
ncbi:arylesterase [Erythrobacter sp.]|uniref:arylesterase n=1 Tax=Erythrobacter sp. TaxID=1042 RepID=UPI0025BE7E39|nr:arylesterase [Erythrobacter sp.]